MLVSKPIRWKRAKFDFGMMTNAVEFEVEILVV